MSTSDGDYPDLDISSSSLEGTERHVVGPPPCSDVESDEYEQSQDENHQFYDPSGYESSDGEFDVEQWYAQSPIELPSIESIPIGNPNSLNTEETFKEIDESSRELFRVTLTAALAAGVEFLENGFEPAEINKCLQDVGYGLRTITDILLGRVDMPNQSLLEYCHALADAGWLEKRDGKFFAIFPETDEFYVTSLVKGSERLREYEETKKKQADQYESEEEELRVLHTFNMIAELLHKVRDSQKQLQISYSCLSNAYRDMVKGRKYPEIHEKYSQILQLDPDRYWNPQWFNHYCKRSSLKNFLNMSRFSEIVITDQQPTTFYFRADNENRRVKTFGEKDFEEVRQKHRSGNNQNKNFGKNYGSGGGQRGQQRRQIEPDPNYRPAILGDSDDDGSLARRSSPVRNRSPEPVDDGSLIRHRSPVRNRSPEPAYRPDTVEDGSLIRRSPSPIRNRSPIRDRSPPRLQNTAGDTSSEGEFTSEGSFSSEDEERKEMKIKRRAMTKKKREEKEEMRRKKHEEEEKNRKPTVTRFQNSKVYKTPDQQEEESESDSGAPPPVSTEPSTSEQWNREQRPLRKPVAPAPAKPVEPPREPTPEPEEEEDDEEILPLTVDPGSHRIPARISSSRHNELQSYTQVPFRPTAAHAEEKRERMEKTRRKEEAKDMERTTRRDDCDEETQRNGGGTARSVSNFNVARQGQNYAEPRTNGFAPVKSFATQNVTTHQQPQQAPLMDDNYRGINQMRKNQQRPPTQQPPQNYPPYGQGYQQQYGQQLQYPQNYLQYPPQAYQQQPPTQSQQIQYPSQQPYELQQRNRQSQYDNSHNDPYEQRQQQQTNRQSQFDNPRNDGSSDLYERYKESHRSYQTPRNEYSRPAPPPQPNHGGTSTDYNPHTSTNGAAVRIPQRGRHEPRQMRSRHDDDYDLPRHDDSMSVRRSPSPTSSMMYRPQSSASTRHPHPQSSSSSSSSIKIEKEAQMTAKIMALIYNYAADGNFITMDQLHEEVNRIPLFGSFFHVEGYIKQRMLDKVKIISDKGRLVVAPR